MTELTVTRAVISFATSSFVVWPGRGSGVRRH